MHKDISIQDLPMIGKLGLGRASCSNIATSLPIIAKLALSCRFQLANDRQALGDRDFQSDPV
jgi:hypothetical protein